MKRLTIAAVSIVSLLAAGGAAVAVAASGGGTQVDAVHATFAFASTHELRRVCAGEGGPYMEIRAHHEGTQTGDPRLTGALTLEAHNLVSLTTGLGTSEGTFTLRDPATGRLKARGTYAGIFTEGSKFDGLSTATLTDGEHESEEIAVLRADVDLATGVVSGELGGAWSDGRSPAVIQRVECTGPWTHVENGSASR